MCGQWYSDILWRCWGGWEERIVLSDEERGAGLGRARWDCFTVLLSWVQNYTATVFVRKAGEV